MIMARFLILIKEINMFALRTPQIVHISFFLLLLYLF